ncbi:3-oxoacyl-ACP reductase FabG [Aquisalimonas lutea]|uniref:3-oxoacyl-ACP reductase FabG n=1 Tax=Aquisalimonas lutea TaxID=1327750 RepID=UPI0025B2BEEF|nr:3-oxoacyl-ACP reductase FabG [Aquisalimonas lutea]MDN3517121.1 3-oxoacyl-ACP reductase FabG [Aquisalimonas lutea]
MEAVRALVTGGSGDLGQAICRALSGLGYHVIVHANRRAEAAQALARALRDDGGSAEATSFDVADAEAARAALEGLLEDGPIQVLVNNAGFHDDGPMAGMSTAQWQRVVDVNLGGFFNVTQPLLLPMARRRWGRIVSISSVAGVAGNPGQVNYAAAKSGLHGAARSLAREMGSRNITVNVVAPGIIAGTMTDGTFDASTIKAMVPLGRAGAPEEVADLVAFLCSQRAGYISGQVIGVNGGMA